MMMSGGMPPTAGGMGVMGVMSGYLGGGREYLEGGGVGVDSSVWVPPFWEDPHLADAHLHDPSIAEAAHMGEPPSMGDVGGGDLMDAFPPHQQHGKHSHPQSLAPKIFPSLPHYSPSNTNLVLLSLQHTTCPHPFLNALFTSTTE
ncbi:hypothetical protein E2C01_048990 [Portunus trituberculatus]|uniref:Uncharacterized protein n=1 Tax=Portunus trituberculatus TaxID=210409 RepID=A0A5B7GD04_PORTR|nr:hypothetical protein [Portunus trituberculatus]